MGGEQDVESLGGGVGRLNGEELSERKGGN